MKKIIVVGSGFASLSAACYISAAGYDVEIYEKNDTIGGRARKICREGFVFDMGPTFYWMPDVFERFFADFGLKVSDFYKLERLNPSYKVYFDNKNNISLPASVPGIGKIFEQYEAGSSIYLYKFLKNAAFNYQVAMDKMVYKPGHSFTELITRETVTRGSQFINSLHTQIKKGIKDPFLRQIIEFPVLFLGAKPSAIPSFYCFMNYADMELGTWHVTGGMYEVVKGMEKLALSLGVKIHTSGEVNEIIIEKNKVKAVSVNGELKQADVVISGADYHHTEHLLGKKYRNYSENYWNCRVMAPSALLYYVAFDKKLHNICHHTLFFDADFVRHAEEIYDHPAWPQDPLFYASFPSVTDPSLSPPGKETGIFLIPIAAGLHDTPEIREEYFSRIIERMEKLTGQDLKKEILFYESFAARDFEKEYFAYKGNAYGLANTLMQTAFLKPKIKNKKVKNLFYTGQLTVPGPGMPTALISGKIASKEALSYLNQN